MAEETAGAKVLGWECPVFAERPGKVRMGRVNAGVGDELRGKGVEDCEGPFCSPRGDIGFDPVRSEPREDHEQRRD